MGNIKHLLIKAVSFLTAFMCLIFAFPVYVFAADFQAFDNQNCSIQISLSTSDKVFSYVKIKLYRVLEITEDNGQQKTALSPKFAKYPIRINDDSEDLRELITTAEGLIVSEKIEPDYFAVSDENGNVSFNSIIQGGYLVVGEKFEQDEMIVFPTSSFVTLPFKDSDGEIRNSVHIDMKYDKQDKNKKITVETMKVWKDNNSKERPKSITVELYCDGKLYKSQVLSEENNWRFKWENLDADSKWLLSEKDIPNSYYVSVSRQGNSFLVTNSIENTYTPKTPTGKLPQTGIVFWPIPLLFVTGAVFIVIGMILKRGNNAKK